MVRFVIIDWVFIDTDDIIELGIGAPPGQSCIEDRAVHKTLNDCKRVSNNATVLFPNNKGSVALGDPKYILGEFNIKSPDVSKLNPLIELKFIVRAEDNIMWSAVLFNNTLSELRIIWDLEYSLAKVGEDDK